MTMIQRALATTAALLLLVPVAACSSGGAAPVEAGELESTPVEEVEEVALPPVSLSTTCHLLFGSNVDGPVSDATDIIARFVENPDLSTVTTDELESTISALDGAAKNADPGIKPYINATSQPLQAMLDALQGQENTDINFTDYKAAGLELITQCTPYL